MAGFWLSTAVRHSDMGMNNAEGISEKTSVSKWMVKSNPSRQLSTVGPRELSPLQVENNMLGRMLQDEKQDGLVEPLRCLPAGAERTFV